MIQNRCLLPYTDESAHRVSPTASVQCNHPGLRELDVICGRDKQAQTHSGNRRFRKLIRSERLRYKFASKRREKSIITDEIIAVVQEQGGRFVKLDEPSGQWVEVDGPSIHEKVSHALRSCKDPRDSKIKRQQEEQETANELESAFQSTLHLQHAVFLNLMSQAKLLGEDETFDEYSQNENNAL